MRLFIQKTLLFLIPFGIYFILVLVIDPFNYFNGYGYNEPSRKYDIAEEQSPHLFKMIKFKNEPKRNIVIGDSRSNALYYRFEQQNWGNLAYGGASLREMIDSFWYAVSISPIDSVVMGISLNLYNKYNKRFWIEESLERQSSVFGYALNTYTFNTMVTYLSNSVYETQPVVDNTNAFDSLKRVYWEEKLAETDKFFSAMGYPEEYYNELAKIAQYCEDNEIHLLLWIPPNHRDYQEALIPYHLEAYTDQFKRDLLALDRVYDFNIPSTMTSDYESFRDPVHFTDEAGVLIFEVLTGKRPANGLCELLDQR
ncbi:hypothetical protein [Lunatimonas salinarum]|uniref:hypothetical protein n=1 Tax=Lunatimonas salinarum TaxID=1774590 RepID=UPI001ADF9AC3|nr:hypothetical protein [Lunatimonas salinarum]